MDILIKSFNRPFYLDRCISSIEKYVLGNPVIKILDDGTPPKYLNLIKKKHPQVTIITSHQYTEKVKSIEKNIITGEEIDGFTVPTQMWVEEANKSSDYFLITEDDVWFTDTIDLVKSREEMKNFNTHLLKLGWFENINSGKFISHHSLSETIETETPDHLFTPPAFIFKPYYYNQFKLFSLLFRLGLVNHTTKEQYWALNSILMGFWKKEYWLEVWKGIENKVDEKKQLYNATLFYRKNKSNKNFICKTKQLLMKTTFKSSATNSHHQYGISFDVDRFNYIMNEAWYENDLSIWENFPNDFSDSYFISFLNNANDPRCESSNWIQWSENFKNQYRKLGIIIE